MAHRRRLIVVLALLVLLAHGIGLDLLSRGLASGSRVRAFVDPLYTRVIQPTAPVSPQPSANVSAAPEPASRRKVVASLPSVHAPEASKGASPPPVAVPPAPLPPPEIQPAAAAALPLPPPQLQRPPDLDGPAGRLPPPTPTTAGAAEVATTPAADAGSSAASAGDGWPPDTRLSYRLGGHYRGELFGQAQVRWQREADRYQTRIDIGLGLLGGAGFASEGRLAPDGLRPSAYEERVGSRTRGNRFDETQVRLNDGRAVPKPAGIQDTASQFVELTHRFATGASALQVGQTVSFWLARPGGVDLWTYDVLSRGPLRTAGLGEVEVFHLKPRPLANPRGNITAEMWFAPSLQYLPARIRIDMGGDTFVDLLVEKIEQR